VDSSRLRVGKSRHVYLIVASSVLLGVAVTLTVIFCTGAIDLSPRYLLALGGIIVGNTMMVATLAGRAARGTRWT